MFASRFWTIFPGPYVFSIVRPFLNRIAPSTDLLGMSPILVHPPFLHYGSFCAVENASRPLAKAEVILAHHHFSFAHPFFSLIRGNLWFRSFLGRSLKFILVSLIACLFVCLFSRSTCNKRCELLLPFALRLFTFSRSSSIREPKLYLVLAVAGACLSLPVCSRTVYPLSSH